MTVDLCGSGGPDLSSGLSPLCTFRPQRRGLYILMPERPGRHNNTIDLVGVFRVLRSSQRFVIFAFDTPEGRPYKRGSRDERGHRKAPRTTKWRGVLGPTRCLASDGLDPRVVCSMHRLFGKGYAGGGDHQLRPSGWTVFSSSLVRDPGLRAGE